MSARPPLVLAFAASDPTGGAGVQADLLTLASMGCHPLSVITALTVQDTSGVESVLPIDAETVLDQARCLLDEMAVSAFKLGVLGSTRNIEAIARLLAEHPHTPVIVDPVLASGRGDALASDEMAAALCELVVPQTTVLTPNSLEARRLGAESTLEACAQRLLSMGCDYVLVKGTHEPGEEVLNTLYDARGVVRADRWPRLAASYHGSGCTLASAIAAALANGLQVPEAVREAQEYTRQALERGFRPGKGQHLPNRLFRPE